MGAVPGVLSRIAEIEPPADTAPMMPPISIMACSDSMVKVSGISSAIAVVPPSPGITPNNRPTTTPMNKEQRAPRREEDLQRSERAIKHTSLPGQAAPASLRFQRLLISTLYFR